MQHYSINDLKRVFPSKTDQELINALSMGVLKLSQQEINTISFVFFLSHIAERDMEAVLTQPWKILEKIANPKQIQYAKKRLNSHMTRNKFTELPLEEVLKEFSKEQAEKIRTVIENRYREKTTLDIDKLETFGDKILAYESIKSKNNVSRILWKIKELRDDISHGKITGLSYEEKPLTEREAKVKLFFDYMLAINAPEDENSKLEKSLETEWSPEEDAALDAIAKDLLDNL